MIMQFISGNLATKWMDNLHPGIFIMPVIALSIAIILYVRFVKEAPRKHLFKTFSLTLFTLAFLMNFLWELLHGPFYEGVTYDVKMISFFALASIADAIMVVLIYFSFSLIYKDPLWIKELSFKRGFFIVIVGGIGAVLTEIRHLSERNWSYDESMPIIPVVGVGLSPVLQFMLLPLFVSYISFYFVKTKIKIE